MFSYESLEVYKTAYSANKIVYRFLKSNLVIPRFAKDQLGRASLSVLFNIAEGSAKFSNKDRRRFYVIARGSVFECSALVNVLHEENEMAKEQVLDLSKMYEKISRMLFAMIKKLEE
jgi:four helix bundle protein